MKIIQIIANEGDIFGLCDKGQLWCLKSEFHPTNWVLVEIPSFVRMNSHGDNQLVQGNGLYLN
jgi:hypothetical protein